MTATTLSSPTARPSAPMRAQQVLAGLSPNSRKSSSLWGILLCVGSLAIYAVLWATTLLHPELWVRLLMSVATGLVIGSVFIVGHDACHGSLTPKAWLNQLIGRLCFLPSLHPYISWDYYHNGLHHGKTNLKGVDPVYVPFSKEEYDALPPIRRWAERIYRTPLGLSLYYGIQKWLFGTLLLRVNKAHVLRRNPVFHLDLGMVLAFMAAQVAVCVWLGLPSWQAVALNLLLVIVIPQLTWNWLMGFATFQHHTHPRVKWFKNLAEWSYYAAQVQNTVHIVYPPLAEKFLLNIMSHTAHHVDPKIPLYRLPDAQSRLQLAHPGQIIVEAFNWKGFLHTLKTCQLYDYDAHRWMNFKGQYTT